VVVGYCWLIHETLLGLNSLLWVLVIKQEAFETCWAHSLLRAVLHCHSPGVATAATVARRQRIDVHDDDDDDDDNDNDNDNA